MKNKVVERRNGRYQINEGIFDIIKILITGKSSDLTKIKDKKLSKAGKELKKNMIAVDDALEDEAKNQGKTKDEYIQDMLSNLGKR